jgi:hypothetical protein
MSKEPPTVEMISDGEDLFVVVNGVKVAKRGRPGTAQANTWVSLGPGWTVLDRNYPEEIEVMFEGVRISLIERVRQDERRPPARPAAFVCGLMMERPLCRSRR